MTVSQEQRGAAPGAPGVAGTPPAVLALQAPPARRDGDQAVGLLTLLPVLGSVGSIALVSGLGGEHRARGLLAAGLILFATVGFVVVQADRQRRRRRGDDGNAREAYRHHLAEVRRAARAAAVAQATDAQARHPPPTTLPGLVPLLAARWPRTPEPGALPVRYGLAPGPLSPGLVPPAERPATEPPDPVAATALRRLLDTHGVQERLPATVDLRATERIEVCGEEEPVRDLARAIVCAAATRHPPTGLAVAVLSGREAIPHWDWVKWLPHAGSPRAGDALGPARLVDADPDRLLALLPEGTAEPSPHLLLVLDGAALPMGHPLLPAPGREGVTVLDLPVAWDAPASPARLRLELPDGAGHPGAVVALRPGEPASVGLPDRCGPATAEAVARRLAAVAAAPDGEARETDAVAASTEELVGLPAPDVPAGGARWPARPERERLRVAVGVDEAGVPVHLDLKEAAQDGMGPHGVLVGATGSGKSELLRTLALGLAAGHPPEQLALVLVDFKGGATFAGLAGLPQVSALITNLEGQVALVDRMREALGGELARRQEVLHRAGHASRDEHERARAAGAPLEPMPSLVVVVDEFAELLAARPEFLDLFVAIGRLGRSLGLHLLLASQRLDEGRLRGLEAHLSYRIGLRTFSAAESRAVLGVPDAAELPSTPGLGYLRTGPGALRRFRAAHVSGPAVARPAPGTPEPSVPGARGAVVVPFSAAPGAGADTVAPSDVPTAAAAPPNGAESLLDRAVRQLSRAAPPARRIWLPPLAEPDPVGALLPDLTADPALGLVSPTWRGRGPYLLPLGTVDRPREQRRDTLTVDLRDAGGHLAVVGGPRSGKSTLLRTAVLGLALTTTPRETQVLVLDFGGGTCAGLAALPHVAGAATRAEPDAVRRTLAEATALLDERAALFRARGIESADDYRARRARGEVDDGWGDVFVVVDGWQAAVTGSTGHPARAEPAEEGAEHAEAALRRLAAEGLTYGVHLLVAASRWTELRPGVREAFATRLELRLGDPLDSEVDRRAAASVPAGRPGRGLTADGHHFLAALPCRDRPGAGGLGPAAADLVRDCAEAWRGPDGPRLRLLPERVDLTEVRQRADVTAPRLLLGVGERRLEPVTLDPGREPHLLVLGDAGSGKTAALRAYADEVCRTRSPEEAQLVVVDYRRSLLAEVPETHLLDHLTSAAAAGPALADLATTLEQRLPGPGATPAQLRDRSWWSGPEVFVLVDDHDLVAGSRDSPVLALEHLLAQARDVGLHLVVARRTGGAARGLHEPVVQTLRDLAAPGLLLPGDPDEGPLLGRLRPRRGPPGRARLLSRDGGVQALQLAWRAPRP